MTTSADDSDLYLDSIRFPYGSNYGLTERLVRPSGNVRLGANGGELNFAVPDLDLWRITYTADDVCCLPATTDISEGSVVNVSCITELVTRVASGSTTINLPRVPVTGSIRAELGDGTPVDAGALGASVSGQTVTISSQASNIYLYWRPQLRCVVISLDMERDEYGARTSWTLTLQEAKAVS